MGMFFHPISQGQIDGCKDGLKSDLTLSRFYCEIELQRFSHKYRIGLGVGYQE